MAYEDEMQAARASFVVECRELLEDMEESLLALESVEDSTEMVNAVFRAAHTIKGSAGLFGLDHVVRFTHVVEEVLDHVREGSLPVSTALVGVLLPCGDHIASLIEGVARGRTEETDDELATGQALLVSLHGLLHRDPVASAGPVTGGTTSGADLGPRIWEIAPCEVPEGSWHLSLRFGPDCLRNGIDPLTPIRFLSTVGDVACVLPVSDAIPAAAAMDPETHYLGYEIALVSSATKEEIEEVFEFVRDESMIRVLPPGSRIEEYIALIESVPDENARIGELLVQSGAVTAAELTAGLRRQEELSKEVPSGERRLLGEILVEERIVQQPIVDAAIDKQRRATERTRREGESIRVDAARLDRLINVVGELVIAGAGAGVRAADSANIVLIESVGEVMRLVEEVRDSALQLRMVPIGTIFGRFQRVVRDVSEELGKQINLVVSGGETEVDKALVEKIGDPLMHLVRNAMDHGIEPAQVRSERGKPGPGVLKLNAFHDSGSIVIEVSDDGGGLDRERIMAKAVERGLVEAGIPLTDQEVHALIFEPGFSTVDQVSNLSGRGVGMDVVKRNVGELRGSVEVESALGVGTTMRIRLPLTLAIIDTFGVKVGGSSFVVPLDHVVECVEHPVGRDSHDYMDLRGEVLPFVRLRRLFRVCEERSRRESVVVVEHAGTRIGLVVDALLGEFQTVIKPLGRLFAHVEGIGGSTILGNGEVALIIDVPTLIRHQEEREKERHVVALAGAGV